jgi:DNA-binding transcriptional LysR family regulator
LARIERPYRVAYTSPNRNAIDAAVTQGLAITAMPEICLRPGMRLLGESEGFPPLGYFDIGLVRKPGKISQAAEALANHIRESFGKAEPGVMAAE